MVQPWASAMGVPTPTPMAVPRYARPPECAMLCVVHDLQGVARGAHCQGPAGAPVGPYAFQHDFAKSGSPAGRWRATSAILPLALAGERGTPTGSGLPCAAGGCILLAAALTPRTHHDFPSLLKWTLQSRVSPSSGVKNGRVLRVGLTDQGLEAQKVARSLGAGRPLLVREGGGTVSLSPCNVGQAAPSIRPYGAQLTARSRFSAAVRRRASS
jgi:hypothetical protein